MNHPQSEAPTTAVESIAAIDHTEAMELTAAENAKFAELLGELSTSQWETPTECPRWSVKSMVSHVAGSARSQASIPEFVRQVYSGRKLMDSINGQFWWDGMNELQVNEREALSPDQLIEEWSVASAAALKSRTTMPRLVARLPLLNLPDPVGRQPIGYLFDMGFTRDVWMHRVDIAFAIDEEPSFDAVHDARIMADIVAEWGATHGEAFDLTITGPAGGRFTSGIGGTVLELEPVEFLRTLTGRTQGTGILRHPLPL
ncbi:MAG: maleylpyruvate isomerase family mycothiol-dependent enzyme [Candidatus Nanopelagicales bacterium]